MVPFKMMVYVEDKDEYMEISSVPKGLKTLKKEDINSQAGSLLQDTDWYTIREAEGGTAMPSNIKTWRAAVRTKANTHCTSIDNAADVDALAALTFDWPAKP